MFVSRYRVRHPPTCVLITPPLFADATAPTRTAVQTATVATSKPACLNKSTTINVGWSARTQKKTKHAFGPDKERV